MKVKIDPRQEAAAILGSSSEVEMTFLLLPMSSYRLIAEQASKEGTTAATIFEKAVLQYIRSANEPPAPEVPKRKPDIVMRRRRT